MVYLPYANGGKMGLNKLKAILVTLNLACLADKPIYLMFVRHAEKQAIFPNNLSVPGWQRADLLAKLLTGEVKGHPCLDEFLEKHKITEVFADQPTNEKPSIRTIETVTPYSQLTGKDINLNWTKTENINLIKQIINNKENDGKLFLFAVSHGRPMNRVMEFFNLSNITGEWDKNRYDWLWILVVQNSQAKLISLPQQLVKTDVTQFMVEKSADLNLVCPNYYQRISSL